MSGSVDQLVQPLVVEASGQRIEDEQRIGGNAASGDDARQPITEVLHVVRHFVRLLIARRVPHLDDGHVIRAIGLREHVESHVALMLAALVGEHDDEIVPARAALGDLSLAW